MPCPHNEITIVQRSQRQSAVATAAYQSGEKQWNSQLARRWVLTIPREIEYSCAMKSHFRKFGNQMSGSGNHLCNYASLLA